MRHRSKDKWMRTLKSTLLLSFYYSCLVHIIIFGLWKMGILELPDELVALLVRRKAPITAKAPLNPAALTNANLMPTEIPLACIEVEPEHATPDQPKDPKFYSKANSVAANAEPKKEAPVPQVDGKQDKIAKLRDVPRAVLPPPPTPAPTPPPPKPAAPPPAPAPTPKPELALQPTPKKEDVVPIPTPEPPKPKPAKNDPPKPSEIAKNTDPIPPKETLSTAAPSPAQPPQPPPPPKVRPKTLAQARQDSGIVGEKMKQDGGVRRLGKLAVDAKATPFGEYDAELIRAVQDRWYSLLDNSVMTTKSGRVVLQFNLKFDGSITDMRVKETEVGEVLALLCERAVRDPSPYRPWPLDMHRMIGGNVRPVVFTFLYY